MIELEGLAAALKREEAGELGEFDPDAREDSCGCFKPHGCYGAHGWHWEISNTGSPQGDLAYEKCPRYWDKVNRWENEEERGAPW